MLLIGRTRFDGFMQDPRKCASMLYQKIEPGNPRENNKQEETRLTEV